VAQLPEGIRAAFAEIFEFPQSEAALNEQTHMSSAQLEHTWLITGTTRDTGGKTLSNVAIALTLDGEGPSFRADKKRYEWSLPDVDSAHRSPR
jgi:hypothetical protein